MPDPARILYWIGDSNIQQRKKQIPLTRIQKLIAHRMLSSKQSKPCFYLELKADITELMATRRKLRKSLGVKITTNAFYIRALGLAAEKYPIMVGKYCGQTVEIAGCINVGFAVNAPQGLVVPVIRDAYKKTLSEIAHQEKLLTDKARDNRLTLEDIEGETIALSNLGVYDIDCFFGIVPPPASTILSIGNICHTAVPLNGRVILRKLISLSLAVDRRVTNEVYAARFLTFIKEQLQRPDLLT